MEQVSTNRSHGGAQGVYTHLLVDACSASGQSAEVRMQHGYDHYYYFISSFMAEPVGWHAARLKD